MADEVEASTREELFVEFRWIDSNGKMQHDTWKGSSSDEFKLPDSAKGINFPVTVARPDTRGGRGHQEFWGCPSVDPTGVGVSVGTAGQLILTLGGSTRRMLAAGEWTEFNSL